MDGQDNLREMTDQEQKDLHFAGVGDSSASIDPALEGPAGNGLEEGDETEEEVSA